MIHSTNINIAEKITLRFARLPLRFLILIKSERSIYKIHKEIVTTEEQKKNELFFLTINISPITNISLKTKTTH